jgi:hypothetical protein
MIDTDWGTGPELTQAQFPGTIKKGAAIGKPVLAGFSEK